ncbi:reverse transcriptase domain-containing protein [Tanacetum coccineum]|uniref:Reverse transcriptase domain-containing protein n=1 Tax=Tanacetum coccineum TaxID=301880 RepID=A0ABQ5ARP2_9ASTR
MADNRTMAQMLQAPIEGYEDAIVVPPINANNFELKQPLINLVQSNKFTGRQDPHNHLRFFNKVTSTFRHPEVPNTSVKLLLFPFSLDGEARDWLDKEPPRSILTWDDLVSKFINQFFPPSKTTYLRNKITNFFQEPNETFNEAWERFKDALISAACAISYDKMPQEAASLEDKMTIKMKQMMNEMKALVVTTPAPVKAVEEDFPDCEDSHACSITQEFHILSFILEIQTRQYLSMGDFGTDNQEKNEKQSQNDKTGLGMEKTVKDKAKSKPKSLEAKEPIDESLADSNGRDKVQTTTHAKYLLPDLNHFHFDRHFSTILRNHRFDEDFLHFEPDAPVIDNFNELNDDQRGSEIDFSEDDDSFTFVIRTFLPFLTYPEVSLLSGSTGSEDTIFDPGIST